MRRAQFTAALSGLTLQAAWWRALRGDAGRLVDESIRDIVAERSDAGFLLLRRAWAVAQDLATFEDLDRDRRPPELVYQCLVLQLPLELATVVARLRADVLVWVAARSGARRARCLLDEAWTQARQVPIGLRWPLDEQGPLLLAAHAELELEEYNDLVAEKNARLFHVARAWGALDCG